MVPYSSILFRHVFDSLDDLLAAETSTHGCNILNEQIDCKSWIVWLRQLNSFADLEQVCSKRFKPELLVAYSLPASAWPGSANSRTLLDAATVEVSSSMFICPTRLSIRDEAPVTAESLAVDG